MGVPLTDVMEFTDRSGGCWLAFVEAIPSPGSRRQTLLPPRRLRFDSVFGSRAITPVPAGAPFLSDQRLQRLLDQATPVSAELDNAPSRSARAAGAALAALAVAEAGRRWKQGATRRHAFGSRSVELAAGAADRVIGWVAGILRGRPRARF